MSNEKKEPINAELMREYIFDITEVGDHITSNSLKNAVYKRHRDNDGSRGSKTSADNSWNNTLYWFKKEGFLVSEKRGGKDLIRSDRPTPIRYDTSNYKNQRIEVMRGRGDSTVYGWYFESQKKDHTRNGDRFFPMKVGFTTKSGFDRTKESTISSPEKGTLAFELKTNEPEKWERLLHAILDAEGKRVEPEETHSSECFYTNPQELAVVYDWFQNHFASHRR